MSSAIRGAPETQLPTEFDTPRPFRAKKRPVKPRFEERGRGGRSALRTLWIASRYNGDRLIKPAISAKPNLDGVWAMQTRMTRILALLFGIFCEVVFFVTFLYQIGFVAGVVVPKSIDDGPVVSRSQAIATHIVLLSLFAIQHTIMARLAFKRWWTTIVPEPIERSVFVLLASLLLLLMNWQWKPLPEIVWRVDSTFGRILLYAAAGRRMGACSLCHISYQPLRPVRIAPGVALF